MRRPFVAGNWKMYGSVADTRSLIQGLKPLLEGLSGVDIGICPPFVYLSEAVALTQKGTIWVGAQNCYPEPKGAFTGEISPYMLKDIGCRFVILGHSERRHILGENDSFINRKVHRAIEAGLEVILCVGERIEEREAGHTEQVVKSQLEGGLQGVEPMAMKYITIAYEPVWAIGTGKNATPGQAQEVHAYIRSWLADRYDGNLSETIRIQYGGSVKPENAADLLAEPDIDGALVGGASLQAESFAAIVKAAIGR